MFDHLCSLPWKGNRNNSAAQKQEGYSQEENRFAICTFQQRMHAIITIRFCKAKVAQVALGNEFFSFIFKSPRKNWKVLVRSKLFTFCIKFRMLFNSLLLLSFSDCHYRIFSAPLPLEMELAACRQLFLLHVFQAYLHSHSLFTIAIDYLAGIVIEQSSTQSKKALADSEHCRKRRSIGCFQILSFFNENLELLMGFAGIKFHLPYMELLLPVGLSFHTFQAMSYNCRSIPRPTESGTTFRNLCSLCHVLSTTCCRSDWTSTTALASVSCETYFRLCPG